MNKEKVQMQEGALCRTCPHLDYDPLLGYHYTLRKIFPIPFCPKKGVVIFKGYKHCSHYPKKVVMK